PLHDALPISRDLHHSLTGLRPAPRAVLSARDICHSLTGLRPTPRAVLSARDICHSLTGLRPIQSKTRESKGMQAFPDSLVSDCARLYFFMFTNWVYLGSHTSSMVPIGPFRCLAIMTSSMSFFSVSLW